MLSFVKAPSLRSAAINIVSRVFLKYCGFGSERFSVQHERLNKRPPWTRCSCCHSLPLCLSLDGGEEQL